MTLLSFSFHHSHSSGGQPGLLTQESRGWQAHRAGWQTSGHVPVLGAAKGTMSLPNSMASLPSLLSLLAGFDRGHLTHLGTVSTLGIALNELKHPRMSRAASMLPRPAQSLAEWLKADSRIPEAGMSLAGENLPLETSQHDGEQSSHHNQKHHAERSSSIPSLLIRVLLGSLRASALRRHHWSMERTWTPSIPGLSMLLGVRTQFLGWPDSPA